MLNKENKITTKCIDCLSLVYIAYTQENYGTSVVMAPITEEQENDLDNEKSIIITNDSNKSFVFDSKACYAYGKLDLSPNSEDIKTIANANWFKNLYINITLFTKYDYNNHVVVSDVIGGRWYETDNIEQYLPFLHAKLGKPERVVIFKDELDLLALRRKNKDKNSKSNRKHYVACKDYYQTYNKNKSQLKRKNRISNLKFTIKKR